MSCSIDLAGAVIRGSFLEWDAVRKPCGNSGLLRLMFQRWGHGLYNASLTSASVR